MTLAKRVTRRRTVAVAAVAAAVLLALAVASFAVPLPAWRNGRPPVEPLLTVAEPPDWAASPAARRVWVDTDAACGHDRRTDPDDCLALVLLARAPEIELVGVSTVFGNAPLEITDATTRALADRLRAAGAVVPAVHRGAASPGPADGAVPAVLALRRALEDGPLTILALGPLTNVAHALSGRPDLAGTTAGIVAVMGRRPGHLFHPAEGADGGILLGHGPVFRDFNAVKDLAAVSDVLDMEVPLTLVPYDAARHVALTEADLAAMGSSGGAAAWAARRARSWLAFWAEDIGRPGFFPFDLVAAVSVVDPGLVGCAEAVAWVGEGERPWNLPFMRQEALLVDRAAAAAGSGAVRAARPVRYCDRPLPDAHGHLLERLTAAGGS